MSVRTEKIFNLRMQHQPTFERLGIADALYFPKLSYKPKGKDEYYLNFFESEFKKGQDIYTEFVSKELDSEDPSRTLYVWKYNPHWEEEYEQVDSGGTSLRYYVPVSELVKIDEAYLIAHAPKIPELDSASFEDFKISELSVLDVISIIHRKPYSKKEWLNNLISRI